MGQKLGGVKKAEPAIGQVCVGISGCLCAGLYLYIIHVHTRLTKPGEDGGVVVSVLCCIRAVLCCAVLTSGDRPSRPRGYSYD